MMMVRGWRLFVALLLTLGLAFPAFAQGAAQAIIEGDRAASAGKWEEALAAFDKAHAANPSSTTGRKRANALYKLKRTVAAYEAYQALLRDHGSTLARGDKDTALKRRDELRDKTGAIKVNASETGARIQLDGEAVGTSPLNAPIRVVVGKHDVRVEKPGFDPFQQSVEVGPNGNISVDASLKAVSNAGEVVVTVKGGEKLTVLIDGAEAGVAPVTVKLSPGPHKISGKSRTMRAPEVSVDVVTKQTAKVELVAQAGGGTIEVRVDDNLGDIFIDGDKVGTGTYKGEVSEGDHKLEVKREGYEDFEKTVTIAAGEVRGETITLRKKADGDGGGPTDVDSVWSFDGLYGGVQLSAMFAPAGTNNTLEESCDVTGATSCSGGTPIGGGLGLYMGYAFDPVGLELLAFGSGDTYGPTASFDGQAKQNVNPLVATPAREEDFTVGRFGGGGAVRLRLLFPFGRFRVTGALGAGLVYRELLMVREASTADGATSKFVPESIGYLSGALSFELAGQVRLGGTTALAVGLNLWLEHAGDGATTAQDNDTAFVKEGEVPRPHATPAYDLAAGTQLFLGPVLGLHFGP